MNKNKNTTAYTDETPEKKQQVTPRFLATIYIIIIVACVALLAFLIVMLALRINRNIELKQEEAAIIEKYNELAQEADPDYANVYFEGNKMVIPSEDTVLEYQP